MQVEIWMPRNNPQFNYWQMKKYMAGKVFEIKALMIQILAQPVFVPYCFVYESQKDESTERLL